MKIEKVEVRIGVTRNLGQYESLRLDEGVLVGVEPGEKPSEIINQGREFLEAKINEDADALAKRMIAQRGKR